jgi:hypothetical protein
MRPITGYAHLMRQFLTVEPRTGQDLYNKPTFGAPVTYRCRLVSKRQQVLAADGTRVTSTMTAYLMTTNAVDPTARITLRSEDVGSTESYAIQPPILATARYSGDATQPWHHSVLYL